MSRRGYQRDRWFMPEEKVYVVVHLYQGNTYDVAVFKGV